MHSGTFGRFGGPLAQWTDSPEGVRQGLTESHFESHMGALPASPACLSLLLHLTLGGLPEFS